MPDQILLRRLARANLTARQLHVYLQHLAGDDLAVIASDLGLSVPAARMLLRRARAKVQDLPAWVAAATNEELLAQARAILAAFDNVKPTRHRRQELADNLGRPVRLGGCKMVVPEDLVRQM